MKQLVMDLPADFEPGEAYGYSNMNYMLISDLIDKVVGYSHQQYIKEEIFREPCSVDSFI